MITDAEMAKLRTMVVGFKNGEVAELSRLGHKNGLAARCHLASAIVFLDTAQVRKREVERRGNVLQARNEFRHAVELLYHA